MKHTIKLACCKTGALLQQGAGQHFHTRVSGQIGRCRKLVCQHQLREFAASELALSQQLARQSGTQKSGAAGDQ